MTLLVHAVREPVYDFSVSKNSIGAIVMMCNAACDEKRNLRADIITQPMMISVSTNDFTTLKDYEIMPNGSLLLVLIHYFIGKL